MRDSNIEIKYRLGEKEDCPKLAELMDIASDGIVEYLCQGLVPEMTPVQVLAHNYEKDNYPHSYKSAIVATDKNDIVGMALSYPSSYLNFFLKKHTQSFTNFGISGILKCAFTGYSIRAPLVAQTLSAE